MSRFLIDSPHTPEECARNLDEITAMGRDALARFEFGCTAVHEAWATVDAADAKAALDILPSFVRGRARAIKVATYTPEQVRKLHSM